MKSFIFCLLLGFISVCHCLSASVASTDSTDLSPNSTSFVVPTTAIATAASSSPDDEEVFMVCSPMRSRQQLMTMLQQSTDELKSSLLASASNPGISSTPQSSAVDLMSDDSFSNIKSSELTEPIKSALESSDVKPDEEKQSEDSTTPSSPRLVARAIQDQELVQDQLKNGRQSSIVNQLMGLLPNSLQNTITTSLNHTRFGSALNGSTLNGSTASTTSTTSTTTSTTVAPATSIAFPGTDSLQDSSIVDDSNKLSSSNSSESIELQSDGSSSTSQSINVTTSTEDPIFNEFFSARVNDQPSLLARLQALALGKQKQHQLHKTLQNSNGPVDSQDPYGANEYDDIKDEYAVPYPSTTSTSSTTVKPKLSLSEKLAALNLLGAKKTTTTAAPKVLFPSVSKDSDHHSDLIAAAIKSKLDRLHDLKEDKKKLKTSTSTTTTTTHRPYYHYESLPLYTTSTVPAPVYPVKYYSGWSQPAHYPATSHYGPVVNGGRPWSSVLFPVNPSSASRRPYSPVEPIAPVHVAVPYGGGYRTDLTHPAPARLPNSYASGKINSYNYPTISTGPHY